MQAKNFCKTMLLTLVLAATYVNSQALENIDISHWYDDTFEVSFALQPIVSGNKVSVFYQLSTRRKEYPTETYSIEWESRTDFNDRIALKVEARDSTLDDSDQKILGVLKFQTKTSVWYLVAKITNTESQLVFYYYTIIDAQWPPNQFKMADGNIDTRTFLPLGTQLKFTSTKKLYGFFYKNKFDAALPPFAVAEALSPFLIADSSFTFQNSLKPTAAGLYVVQEDTTAARGITFLVADATYPKYSQVTQLAAPLIYITTDDEHIRLVAAKMDKPAFDKVILEITNDKERAKSLMRSYFERIESANRYFTDYKEGWKTDRGMLYVIYGKPDQVSRTTTTEIWYYQARKTTFTFRKSGSIFNPENYKLERDNKYMVEWFSMIDLWRKSRF